MLFFSFLTFDILLFQLASTNQEPALRQDLSDWWSKEALKRNFVDWKAVFTYLQETILGNTLLHWMRVGLKKREMVCYVSGKKNSLKCLYVGGGVN